MTNLYPFHRPEKDHPAQLHSLHELFKAHPEYADNDGNQVKLVLVGGSRNQADADRVDALRALAKDLRIEVRLYIYLYRGEIRSSERTINSNTSNSW